MAHELLNGCLVDGDPEQLKREKKIRRRALALSISLQVVALAALLLMPLFAKPAPIKVKDFVPVPPYSKPRPAHVTVTQVVHQVVREQHVFTFGGIPKRIDTRPDPPEPPNEGILNVDPGDPVPGAIPMDGAHINSQVPMPPAPQPKAPSVMHLSHIDASRLTYRIEPAYPVLMRQIGRSGKVELHAMIGEDGTIQSLEAVGGDPGFFASAMQAVKQWRYTPTMLNGQAVKVDTYITVFYNMTR